MESEMFFIDVPIKFSPSIDSKIICRVAKAFENSPRHLPIYMHLLEKSPELYIYDNQYSYDIHKKTNDYTSSIIICNKGWVYLFGETIDDVFCEQ